VSHATTEDQFVTETKTLQIRTTGKTEEEEEKELDWESSVSRNQNEESEAERAKSNLDNHMKMRRLKVAILVYLFASILCVCYFGSYLLSRNVLTEFQTAFDRYRVINTRLPCISESYFFL